MYSLKDGGLADDYWKQYYDTDEVEEIVNVTSTTTLISGIYPLHVRLYLHPHAAPTVVQAHGMLAYGMIFARLQLPFFRAGFNVVQFDVPGMGQSGGPRAGCTIQDVFQAWDTAIKWAQAQFGGPMYAMGIAEDGVTSYYVGANRPEIRAISVHTLFEYGDTGGVHWQGQPWLIRMKAAGLAVASRAAPTAGSKATSAIPFDWVFDGPGDDEMIPILIDDPLALHDVEYRFAYSLVQRQRAPVPFEECRTPVQVIASEKNRIWPYEMVVRNFTRLGGPKELLTLPGIGQWSFGRQFNEDYAKLVIRWFKQNGAVVAARFEENQAGAPPTRPAQVGRVSPAYAPDTPPARP